MSEDRGQGAERIIVIGIGYKPLDKRARKIISTANIILTSNRLCEVFREYEEYEAVKNKIRLINNVDETIEFIRATVWQMGSPERCRRPSVAECGRATVVLLASGDPMFFGIGRRIIREFGKECVEIIPDLSSIQMAFSRIKEPWDDAFLMSLHGGPDPEKRRRVAERRLTYEIKDIPSLAERYDKIAILTDKENNPSVIARGLLKHSALKIYVCERLGYSDENIIEGTPEEIAGMTFRDPNVVIIVKEGDAEGVNTRSDDLPIQSLPGTPSPSLPLFGLTADEIYHSRGLITKDEVRAIVIHKLRPFQKMVFWDIGAGSGSVSLEISRFFPDARVYAIERDTEQIGHLSLNTKMFNTGINVINGEAPEVLHGLPSPDRVFIGGSGGRLTDILEYVNQRMLNGIITINATTLETLNRAIEVLSDNSYTIDVIEANISRLKPLGDSQHLSAENPVFIITGIKGGGFKVVQ